jgi:hypothetical protein
MHSVCSVNRYKHPAYSMRYTRVLKQTNKLPSSNNLQHLFPFLIYQQQTSMTDAKG